MVSDRKKETQKTMNQNRYTLADNNAIACILIGYNKSIHINLIRLLEKELTSMHSELKQFKLFLQVTKMQDITSDSVYNLLDNNYPSNYNIVIFIGSIDMYSTKNRALPIYFEGIECLGKKCLQLAVGVGEETDENKLLEFIKNKNLPVMLAKGEDGITDIFQWIKKVITKRVQEIESV